MLLESFLAMVRHNPLTLFMAPFGCSKAKFIKDANCPAFCNRCTSFAYRETILGYLHTENPRGANSIWRLQRIKICPGNCRSPCRFRWCFASSEQINLSGTRKRDALVKAFGEKQFVDAGNERYADLAFVCCGHSCRQSAQKEAESLAPIEQHFETKKHI